MLSMKRGGACKTFSLMMMMSDITLNAYWCATPFWIVGNHCRLPTGSFFLWVNFRQISGIYQTTSERDKLSLCFYFGMSGRKPMRLPK